METTPNGRIGNAVKIVSFETIFEMSNCIFKACVGIIYCSKWWSLDRSEYSSLESFLELYIRLGDMFRDITISIVESTFQSHDSIT